MQEVESFSRRTLPLPQLLDQLGQKLAPPLSSCVEGLPYFSSCLLRCEESLLSVLSSGSLPHFRTTGNTTLHVLWEDGRGKRTWAHFVIVAFEQPKQRCRLGKGTQPSGKHTGFKSDSLRFKPKVHLLGDV